MKYVLRINITSDGDFYHDSKWIQFKEDYKDSNWFFDKREDAVKALRECYDEVIESFYTSKDYIMNIKSKLKFFIPYLDICVKKFDSMHLSLNNGNQELYFTLGVYDEDKKEIDWDIDININNVDVYDWEEAKKLDDI